MTSHTQAVSACTTTSRAHSDARTRRCESHRGLGVHRERSGGKKERVSGCVRAVRASESRGTETTFLLLFYVFPKGRS